MTSLEQRLTDLAQSFAHAIVNAVAATPLNAFSQVPQAALTAQASQAPQARRRYNAPKCVAKGCGKNLSPRTRPYCGEHWRAAQAKAAKSKAVKAKKPKGQAKS